MVWVLAAPNSVIVAPNTVLLAACLICSVNTVSALAVLTHHLGLQVRHSISVAVHWFDESFLELGRVSGAQDSIPVRLALPCSAHASTCCVNTASGFAVVPLPGRLARCHGRVAVLRRSFGKMLRKGPLWDGSVL